MQNIQILFTKISLIIHSRTTAAIVSLVVLNSSFISSYIDPTWLPLVNGLIGSLAIYFHVNPSQNYTQK